MRVVEGSARRPVGTEHWMPWAATDGSSELGTVCEPLVHTEGAGEEGDGDLRRCDQTKP